MSEAFASPDDDAFVGLSAADVAAIAEALGDGRGEEVRALLLDLHVADLADLIEQLDYDRRAVLIALLGEDLEPELLSELHGTVLGDVLELIGPDVAAAAIATLDSDDAVHVLNQSPEDQQRELLDALPAADRVELERSLAYPEESAGRLMQRDLVAVPDFWSVGRCVEYLRRGRDLPDRFSEIVVVDTERRPAGTLRLDRILRTNADLALGLIMEPIEHPVSVDMDQEQVAFLFQQYHLLSAVVTDRDGRLAGLITADDVADVIEEEVEEDAMRLGGVAETDLQRPVWTTTQARFTWLFVNLGTAILASAVIGLFDAAIEKLVALAILMPIVASMGGNAATQTLTVAVRALATRELTINNARRIVVKELAVGAINGAIFAGLVGGIGYLWFGDLDLGLVCAAAMIINMVAAALSGVAVPLSLERAGVDPAIASGVFVTTVTDVIGFLSFLGLASLILM